MLQLCGRTVTLTPNQQCFKALINQRCIPVAGTLMPGQPPPMSKPPTRWCFKEGLTSAVINLGQSHGSTPVLFHGDVWHRFCHMKENMHENTSDVSCLEDHLCEPWWQSHNPGPQELETIPMTSFTRSSEMISQALLECEQKLHPCSIPFGKLTWPFRAARFPGFPIKYGDSPLLG